jgi:hypothetical protein
MAQSTGEFCLSFWGPPFASPLRPSLAYRGRHGTPATSTEDLRRRGSAILTKQDTLSKILVRFGPKEEKSEPKSKRHKAA